MLNRNVLKVAVVLFCFTLIFSCAQKGPNLSPSDSQQLDGSLYNSKVDNFLVVFDTSSSMNDRYNGTKKSDIAKRVADDMNITLPEMGQTAGLRTLGHAPQVSKKLTQLLYGMENYSSASFAGSLNELTEPGGTTPLSKAIDAAIGDFEKLSGDQNAMIIISDGVENGGSSHEKAAMLKEKYGESLCIYTILVGDSPEGEALMNKISAIGGCGFSASADQLLNSSGMKDFVEKVFLTEKPAPKVVTPAPAPKPEPTTAPKDSDNDGVTDGKDKCPGTPTGAHVNAVGCWVLEQVLFDVDKSVIKPEAAPFLNAVNYILKKNPSMNIILEGHTDNTGAPEYNMALSLKRANAIKDYLVDNGIPNMRIETKGYGLTKPVASNDTESGRSANRRVEIHPK